MADRPDLEALARRYVELWQEQLSASAADPELSAAAARLLQAMSGMGAIWHGFVQSALTAKRKDGDETETAERADAPQRTAAPAAASPARSDGMDELARRLAALEARIARLESRARTAGKPARSRTRARRS